MANFKTRKVPPARPVEQKVKAVGSSGVKKKLRIFIGILLGIITVTFGITYALQTMGGIRLSSNTITFTPIIFSEFGGTGTTAKKMKGTTNILIAGIGGKGHDGANLTDSLMLASINAGDGYVTLLSLPRDLFVAYPKNSGAGRINALYDIGKSQGVGVNPLAVKVSEITGQSIDHYLIIDFSGFKQIVDTLGGVEIDVPTELIDREYPTDNWGYTTFIVHKGLQTFDGDIALKYARSRHSTSDFKRSERQQTLIKAIKNKALSTGFITNPGKIAKLFKAVTANLNTDLTIGDITNFAIGLKDIDSTHINVYNLSNDCVGLRCAAGAYLYSPSREYFGGAAAIIPENATASRLSYYDDIRRFVELIFTYPSMKNEKAPINIVYKKGNVAKARELAMALQKNGFVMDTQTALVETTGSITTSHVNIYWNAEANAGFSPDHLFVKILKDLEDRIPYIMVTHNEYVNTNGPRIEIVLGDDSKSYFTFAKPAFYLPYIVPTSTGGSTSGNIISGESKGPSTTKTKTGKTTQVSGATTTPTNTSTTPYAVAPDQWENF